MTIFSNLQETDNIIRPEISSGDIFLPVYKFHSTGAVHIFQLKQGEREQQSEYSSFNSRTEVFAQPCFKCISLSDLTFYSALVFSSMKGGELNSPENIRVGEVTTCRADI